MVSGGCKQTSRTVAGESVPPDPARLIESMRGFGYSLPSALADLIDNSLAAGSRAIAVEAELAEGRPHIAVTDDGAGMGEDTLVEAMRMGTISPLAVREVNDLGRFGLGLKSASLSQGRVLTVMTRAAAAPRPVIRGWDLDHVAASGRWELLRTPGPAAGAYLPALEARGARGTTVVIEDLDRAELSGLGEREVARQSGAALEAVRTQLSMTFHRFIAEEGVTIRLGGGAVAAWNPFLVGRSAAEPTETFRSAAGTIEVRPFLLPHHSRVDQEEYERAAGPRGWARHQGFYVYRCRRLIVAGSWLGLGPRQAEQTRLARVRVDLPNSADAAWQLDVMKSHVSVPPPLRDDFRRIADDVTRSARRVFGYRGERAAPAPESPRQAVWRRRDGPHGVSYVVDRAHPLIAAVLNGGRAEPRTVEKALRVIERSIPVAAILQEPAKSLDAGVADWTDDELRDLAELASFTIQHFVRSGFSPSAARERVFGAPPFCEVSDELLAAMNLDGNHNDGKGEP